MSPKKKNPNNISVFEHESIHYKILDNKLNEKQLNQLRLFNPDNNLPYYSLIHNGVRFCEYVGVIQIGKTLIEVLPKADRIKERKKEEEKWRKILISMLKASGDFEVKDTSTSLLKIKPNSILDLYFAKFLNEVEHLFHRGLIKKYRKVEGNKNALVGSLFFSKHIQKNLVHKERFYVKYNAYDTEHLLHIIIYKALCILNTINTNPILTSRIGALLLLFPEMPNKKIKEKDFERIIYNRKSIIYKNAINISKLIILNYHPDINQGRNNVLALMFDMNKLWEKFVYVSLRKKLNDYSVKAQNTKNFWESASGNNKTVRADILIENKDNIVVLDTKWKNLYGKNPSSDDLQQLYVYHKYYNAKKTALIYPGKKNLVKGFYKKPENDDSVYECSVITIDVMDNIKQWQEDIANEVKKWAS